MITPSLFLPTGSLWAKGGYSALFPVEETISEGQQHFALSCVLTVDKHSIGKIE